MRSSRAVLAALLVGLAAVPSASAQAGAPADELPVVKLSVPRQARPPSVRVLVGLRDCTTRPTVRITARWRRAPGRAVLSVSGIERVLRRSPRPATRRTDRIIYHRVPRGRPIRAVLITTWREAARGATSCKVHLPRLVGTGAGASAAARGRVRLRTSLPISAPDQPPQRGTALDHIWTCGGARRGDFDCGVTVTVGSEQAGGGSGGGSDDDKKKGEKDDDMDTWETIVLGLIGLASAGGIAAAAAKGSTDRPPEEPPPTWDQLARSEYTKPEEAVGARAGFITKVGAPTAALLTSLAAVFGGLASDAPAGHRVIAVAIVVAVAIGGVLYAFSVDYRARAAVAVARYESLAKHATAEARATATVQSQADKAAADATKAREEATKAQAEAKEAKAEAKEARAQLQKCLENRPPAPERPEENAAESGEERA